MLDAPKPTPSIKPSSSSPKSKKPVILAGHGIVEAGAREQVHRLRRTPPDPRRQHPARPRRLPHLPSVSLGMMGMHGESPGSTTRSSRPTSCSPSACASTTASPATSPTTRPTPKKIHIDIDPIRDQQERQGRRCPHRRPRPHARPTPPPPPRLATNHVISTEAKRSGETPAFVLF